MMNSTSTPNTRSVKTAEVTPGSIFWLPAAEACKKDDSLFFIDPDLDHGCFNHPVLILRRSHKQETALVLILTSLGGRSLRDKFPENPYFRHHHVPIYPCDVHPDSGMQLFLDGSLQLRRDTFVKTEFRYHVNWRLLTPYDDTGRQFKLHPVAFRELLDFLHTPYVKPDDELFAEAGMSNEDVDVDEYASIVNNHSDLDKVLAADTNVGL